MMWYHLISYDVILCCDVHAAHFKDSKCVVWRHGSCAQHCVSSGKHDLNFLRIFDFTFDIRIVRRLGDTPKIRERCLRLGQDDQQRWDGDPHQVGGLGILVSLQR